MSEERESDPNVDRGVNDRRPGETRSMAETDETRTDEMQTDEPMTGARSANDRVVPARTEPIESQRTPREMGYWPEMTQYRQRFDQIQAEFIEEPRSAVQKAEQLVEEAMTKMTSTMRERIKGMHRDAESGDTERLRLEMKSLRDFIESMGGRRAA